MKLTTLFCLLFVVLAPVHAGIIVGTADPANGNSFPFGITGVTGTIYQQVYAPSDFPGAVDITGISFFRTQFGAATDTITDATYTIKLSYSARAVNALDTTTFSNNVGAGQVTFGTYSLTSVTAGTGLHFVDNNSDFVYNPANGPLLVEIDLSSIGFRGDALLDAMNGDAAGKFSRAHNFGSGFTDFGLVTGFDTTNAVPEPATAVLMMTGGLLVLAFLRSRRSRLALLKVA